MEERSQQRSQYAEEWLLDTRESCLALVKQGLPKSALGQAMTSTLKMWTKLRKCFESEVELSDNLAENSMRPVAVGRKNWLHGGGTKAGPSWLRFSQ